MRAIDSGAWRLTRASSLARPDRRNIRHAATRLTASFEYVGPPLDRGEAERLLLGD